MLLFSLLFGNAATVSPCSCAGYTEREKFRKADYVFLGQVVEIADSGQDYFVYAVKFKVEKQWKGARKAERIVNFDYDTPRMCGDLNLAKGKSFLIYAYRKPEGLISYTDCGPNLQIEDAAGSMKKLNQPMYRFLARLYRF
jgi:hypothetical protein